MLIMYDLSTGLLHCDPGPQFKSGFYSLPGWISQWVSERSWNVVIDGYVIERKEVVKAVLQFLYMKSCFDH